MIAEGAAPSSITSHPFVPKDGIWFQTCEHMVGNGTLYRPSGRPCGLAEAAHEKTTLSHTDRIAREDCMCGPGPPCAVCRARGQVALRETWDMVEDDPE